MSNLTDLIHSLPIIKKIAANLKTGRSIQLGGLWGSSYLYLLAAILRQIKRPVFLLVTSTIEGAEAAVEEWPSFLPRPLVKNIQLFPAWEVLPSETGDADSSIYQERLKTLIRLTGPNDSPLLLVAPIQALLQDVVSPAQLRRSGLNLQTGDQISVKQLAEKLVSAEFERVDQVSGPGQFSIRGGLIDLGSYTSPQPVRIELFGDQIESIRTFNPDTQCSEKKIKSLKIELVKKSDMFKVTTDRLPTGLLDYLPINNTCLVLKEPEGIADRVAQYEQRCKGPSSGKTDIFGQCYRRMQSYPRLDLRELPSPQSETDRGKVYNFQINSLQRFSSGLVNVIRELESLQARGQRTVIFCQNDAERQRLKKLFADTAVEKKIKINIGQLQTGFQFLAINTAFIGHQELFNRFRQIRRTRTKYLPDTSPIESFLELVTDDFVVHSIHGIGRYRGIEKLEKKGVAQEFLTVEYYDKSKVYVPTSQIDLVQKYIGGAEQKPKLSKLGTNLWTLRKERVKAGVVQMARELLQIQAIRSKETGIIYSGHALPAGEAGWQQEFEAAFPYEETPDQITINEQIKKDMSLARPMDRLICGDVGYGKTELAMRAAFRAVIHGKQVAILVPTTILAQQHYLNFSARTMDYPVQIEVLSRFKTKKEQAKTIKKLNLGEVDIVIGTHRLLQPDIKFKDLGLIVIDEEQRFGVEHKERLKRLRATVDVLTLTATPIPRTLHMSLLGIKDISSLTTPPRDRRAVETRVARFNRPLIREAVMRELSREGQVYFVHNRVYDIEAMVAQLQELIPEARINVGHGQLPENLLEQRMNEFMQGQIDLLVCTNIIESGLDIPRANTLFVNNADHFGLADLHQLRGRVGRYKHQAFAYFLIPVDRIVPSEAAKRLKAIQEFNELGAGFKIAMRDMEIRGAGNILGREQHGYIASIGYDLYCRLLKEAVQRVKDGTIEPQLDTTLNLNISAYLPTEYISSDKQRIEIYRQIARAKDQKTLDLVCEDLQDRFGRPIPEPVEILLKLATVRVLANRQGISNLTQGIHDLEKKEIIIATYHNKSKALQLKRRFNKLVSLIDEQTMYFHIPSATIKDPDRTIQLFKKIFS